MTEQAFFGRSSELRRIREMADSEQFECLILYGRRRVGKTSLLREAMKDRRGIYFAFDQQNEHVLLEKFSHVVLALFPSPYVRRFESFEQAFHYLADLSTDNPLILALDEFQYLALQNPSLLSIMQNLIDQRLLQTRMCLVLCGSYVSFMENEVLGYASPLYGRRTGAIHLQPMRFAEARHLLKGFDATDMFQIWGIAGGMPMYLRQFDRKLSFRENLIRKVLAKDAFLHDEPMFALRQELREPGMYFSILEAVAGGRSKYNEVATYIGCDAGYYLNTLLSLGVLRRETPFGEKESARRSIYRFADPFFHFWFRFVGRNSTMVELEREESLYDEIIKPDLNGFLGDRFEAFCRESLEDENGSGTLPLLFTKIGRWWGTNPRTRSQEEIDLVASSADGSMLFCECKWRTTPATEADIRKLLERMKLIPCTRAHGMVFSRSGYTKDAVKTAREQGVRLRSLQTDTCVWIDT